MDNKKILENYVEEYFFLDKEIANNENDLMEWCIITFFKTNLCDYKKVPSDTKNTMKMITDKYLKQQKQDYFSFFFNNDINEYAIDKAISLKRIIDRLIAKREILKEIKDLIIYFD